MNQILFLNDENNNYIYNNNISKKKTLKPYFFLFLLSTLLLIILSFYFSIHLYKIKSKGIVANNLTKSFNLHSLYNNSEPYNATFTSLEENNSNFDFYIIGILRIDKIDLYYPILSSATDESLKIAPCRFSGPLPNEIGNLCIAGHNYIDNSFFGKLDVLDINDTIIVYDIYGNMLEYKIFKISEVDSSDLSCTSQETNGKRIVTLMTCNNFKDKRMIFSAIENNM